MYRKIEPGLASGVGDGVRPPLGLLAFRRVEAFLGYFGGYFRSFKEALQCQCLSGVCLAHCPARRPQFACLFDA